MSKLPNQKKIQKEAIPSAPSWMDQVITIVNIFMENVYYALNKNLTFEDNIRSQTFSTTFTTSSSYVASSTFEEIRFKIDPNIVKPQGVLLLKIEEVSDVYSPITNATSLDWFQNDRTMIIRHIAGLKDSTKYKVCLIVI